MYLRSDIRKVGVGAVHFIQKVCWGGGGGAVRFRSDTFVWHTENTLSLIINSYNFDQGGCSNNELNCRYWLNGHLLMEG